MNAPEKKILLVEDEAIIAMAESRLLKGQGYSVVSVLSGSAAVEAIRKDPELSLVLMDIDLGKGIDGTEAARQILTVRDLPIVFLTSHSERAMVERVRDITRYGYIIKNSGSFVLLSSIEMAYELFDVRQRSQRNEEALSKRLLALTQPLEAGREIAFEDLFDPAEIQRIQDSFSDATGVASVITDVHGKPVTEPSNFTRLCFGVIRKTEIGRQKCYNSDATLGQYNPEGPNIMRCLSCGLWDAGAAITVDGRHVANWLIGQVRNELSDLDQILQYSQEIGADPEEFRQALEEVPVMSQASFQKIAQALHIFANELSQKAYQNVLQARSMVSQSTD